MSFITDLFSDINKPFDNIVQQINDKKDKNQKEILSVLVKDAQPYSEEEQLKRQQNIQALVDSGELYNSWGEQPQEPPKKSFWEKMFGSYSFQGEGKPTDPETQKQIDEMLAGNLPEENIGTGETETQYNFEQYLPPNTDPNFIPKQPPQDIADIIHKWFGDSPDLETQAVMTAYAEQRGDNPYQSDAKNVNSDGTVDRGLFQINEGTFADWAGRRPDLMEQYGLSGATYDDMLDPDKNTAFARLLYDVYGNWSQWAGPVDTGYLYATE